jgi:predicted secreted Zn-dependent protease
LRVLISQGGPLSQRIAPAIAAAASFLIMASCASAPRNKALDSYPAGVIGRTSVIYYDVHGRTFAELRADMRRLGPKIADSSFVGETRSPMRWSWRTEAIGPSSCAIRDVTLSVNAQVTLPRWTPPADTEPGLAAEWTRFITALETHEAGHKDISAKAGRDIVDRLRGLSGLCSQISTRASDLARDIVARAVAEQKAYDAATRHGVTQGTSFGAGRGGLVTLSATAPLTLLAAPRAGTVRGFFPVTLERAWSAMPAVYTAVDLAINATDSTAHIVGDSLTARGKLGSFPLSDLINCGTPPSGRNADSVDVALFVTSRLEVSQPSNIAMTNTVQAVAHPAGTAPILCRSSGVVERRLLEALRRELAR